MFFGSKITINVRFGNNLTGTYRDNTNSKQYKLVQIVFYVVATYFLVGRIGDLASMASRYDNATNALYLARISEIYNFSRILLSILKQLTNVYNDRPQYYSVKSSVSGIFRKMFFIECDNGIYVRRLCKDYMKHDENRSFAAKTTTRCICGCLR